MPKVFYYSTRELIILNFYFSVIRNQNLKRVYLKTTFFNPLTATVEDQPCPQRQRSLTLAVKRLTLMLIGLTEIYQSDWHVRGFYD